MLTNTRRANVDRDEVTCPYNDAHVIVASRLGNHLIKCSKNYPDMPKEKCQFNSDHIVPKHELEYHMESCPDRRKWDLFTHKIGNSLCPVKDAVPIHVEVPACEENWDDDPVGPSPLDVINEKIKEKPVVRVLHRNGMTKSQRKAFNQQEQRRFSDLDNVNAKIAEKKEPKKVPATTSSSNTPLRLPKTSKVKTPATSDNIEQLSKNFESHTLSETSRQLSQFESERYYEDSYMGGYSMPSADRGNTDYGEESDDNYGAKGYDVDYYGGYTGGYGEASGNCEESEEEEPKGLVPRWMSRGGGKLDEGHADEQVKRVQHQSKNTNQANPKKKEVSLKSGENGQNYLSSTNSSSDQLKKKHFQCEVDEMGFFKNPITGRGRGSKRF